MTIRVAVVGIGNCACSLYQVVEAAAMGALNDNLVHKTIGGYKISDIEFTAAFDIDVRKVGVNLGKAIFAEPNCTTKYLDFPLKGVYVSCGRTIDGIAPHMQSIVIPCDAAEHVDINDVVKILKESNSEIVISYLPVGSDQAASFYAHAAAEAGCGFINCMPAKIATSEYFKDIFKRNKLPLLGDDIKSQIGSTVIHKTLISMLKSKNICIERTYQLNIGGNTDFKNMRDPIRAMSKRFTKEASLKNLVNENVELSVGPSDYVPHLKDYKIGYIEIEGTGLLGMPFSIAVKLKVEDSPNSAAVVIDAIRAIKLAIDRKQSGTLDEICPFFFKNPPQPMDEDLAKESFRKFIV